jgi:hypothetical protein
VGLCELSWLIGLLVIFGENIRRFRQNLLSNHKLIAVADVPERLVLPQ